jgi:phage/plasmid-like protein (TIGR03299 family)
MLEVAQADFDVLLTRVAAVDDNGELILNTDGTPVIIRDSRATVRQNPDGTFDPLSTVGTRYEVRQNREVLERALAVVGASAGDAVMDTVGVLRDGKRFFATIELGALVIDPKGINDRIARYLVVSSGHDGVWPIRYANTDIRAVCKNTVALGIKEAERVFTARHTRNVDHALEDAREVLRISVEWAKHFQILAEKMLLTKIPLGSPKIDQVINKVFPDDSDTSRQRKNRNEAIGLVKSIYNNSNNVGKCGHNGWSLYNAIVEYLDHFRGTSIQERAIASMDEASLVTQKKLLTQAAVLS